MIRVNILAVAVALLAIFGMWNWSNPPIIAYDIARDNHIAHPGGIRIMALASMVTLFATSMILIVNWLQYSKRNGS